MIINLIRIILLTFVLECEHNGKFYANGEKLETPPGGECKVCYCRGGEVQCAEVSCYIRKDCEGKRVPGKCCPKYDHCPPIDPVSDVRSPYTTEITLSNLNKENYEPWPITAFSANVTESTLRPTSNDIQDENKIPDTNYYEATTVSYKATEVEDLQKEAGVLPRITIQEIIPERKEIPVTAPPRIDIEPQGTLIIEEAEEFLNHSNDLVVTDSDADSSEISEVFQQPPPVLRIGDKLLFLKKGEFVHEKDTSTPNSVITIIGAEGLQRGFEDSGEIHEVKIDNITKDNDAFNNSTTIPEENLDVTTNLNNTDTNVESTNQENIDKNEELDSNKEINISELNTAASTHILSLVRRKNKPTGITTEASFSISTTESQITNSTTELNVLPETSTTSSTTIQDTVNETSVGGTTEISNLAITTTLDALDILTTEEFKNSTENILLDAENNTEIKEFNPLQSSTKRYEVISEQNPAYPPLPDIMSPNIDDTSQRFDIDNTEKYHTAENTTTLPSVPTFKILPEVLEIRSNKTVPQNITNSEWLKINPDTLINYKATLPDDLLNQPAPTDFDDSTEIFNNANITTADTPTETLATTTESDNFTTLTSVSITEDYRKHENIVTLATAFPEETRETAQSGESLENMTEDSGESTTPKNNHASIIDENASIENLNKGSSEVDDMVSTRDAPNDNSGENTTPSFSRDSGRIDKEWNDNPKKNNTDGANNKDVEIIDTTTLQRKTPAIEKTIDTTTTAELLPRPEKILQLPSKTIGKRENSPDDEAEEVFKELENELNSDTTERTLNNEEEEKEADAIFKELLEDTSTPKTKKGYNRAT
ncbi:hypothetical protein NQ314_008274 [Rhamnusium bicolor]|uniref:VWFC domain-containing protein n=1 Tax=Rhamnusium bicolor TaxID=1586634 RepID=A0AAV8YDJ4_9CUCU|nr:hypothetical protein NQ314_008274 [Rhamnusium bicolor]